MPIIDAQPFPDLGHVLVDTDWADVPAATCVQVVRVRLDTPDTETPLRPYIYPCGECGEYIHTSGGRAIFWDTEAPLDTMFFYRTRACGFTIPGGPIFDSFSRTVSSDWGVADTTQPWTTSGGSASDFFVSAGTGKHSAGTVNITRRTVIGAEITDFTMRFQVKIPAVALTAAINVGPMWRYTDTNNHYRLNIAFATDNTVDLTLSSVIAGVVTTLATANNVQTYIANDVFEIRLDVLGDNSSAKVWHVGTPEPAAFQITGTDSTFFTGQVGLRTILSAGNTNTLPVIFEFDNFSVDPVDTQTETGPLYLASDEGFWLRDPVRPCNDRRIELCFAPNPACLPGPGIFFIEMGSESYPNNGGLLPPANRRRPLPVHRQRRDADSMLTLATRMFSDRDNLLTTLEPGSGLLFSGPPNYGIPDRYMFIPPVEVGRVSPDHRYQPRLHQLPYTTIDRPVGTTQGVCGSQFSDLCDVYGTWDAMATAGLTWFDLFAGVAGGFDPGWKTYAEYDVDFSDYAASTATGLTYHQLLWGDY